MQRQLMKRGSVETNDSPYKDFDKDFNEVLKLLHSHQKDNPKCNVEESEWDARVHELMTAFENLPSIIVNSVYQPNIDSTRSPFAPKGRGEAIKRNLFKSPLVQVRERAVEEYKSAEDREGMDVDEDSESLVAEGPSNSISAEMTELKERLLRTDVKTSREERGKVVDDIVANKDVLAHSKCLVCGYEFSLFKNLNKHYRNVKCKKPTNIKKKPENKGSIKPVASRPTSKPVVSRERVAVESAETQSDQAEEVVGREEGESAEPHSDPEGEVVERVEGESAETQSNQEGEVVERVEGESAETQSNHEEEIGERVEGESAEPHSDEEGKVVETSIIEDKIETNSILSDLNSHHQEIDVGDLLPRLQGREREEEEERIYEEVGERTKKKTVLKISYNPENETMEDFCDVPILESSDHQNVEDHTILEEVVPERGLSPILRVEPEPEKRNRLESEGEADYEINPPDFIAKQLPEWRMGDDLQDTVRSILFSKDPKTLYDTKDQLLTSLANVKTDYNIQDVPEEYMNALEQACGASTETETQEILSTQKDFTEYVSPDHPTGRIGLRDDYQYIWMSNKRIQGKGKTKKPETIIQYCRILFGHGSISLYNFLESRGKKLEDFLFPEGFSSSLSILVEWANIQPNPSTQSKKIINIRGNFMIDIRLYFIFLGMRHNALGTLYDYFWEKADKFHVNIRDVHMVTQRIEYQRNQVLFPREDGTPHQMNNVYSLKAWKVLILITSNLLLILGIRVQ